MAKRKILLVDNNKVILKLLTHMLERMGHEVKAVEDGLSALEMLESYQPDVMFIDLIMPRISGDLLCRVIRKRKEFDNIFLTILSAVAAEEEVDFIDFGANACIAKGPAKEMEKHIAQVLRHVEENKKHPFSGNILGVQDVYKREITTELLEKKKHFEITLENMGGGFLELTWSGKIVCANTTAGTFFNSSREELLTSNFLDHFAPPVREYVARRFKSLHQDPLEIGEDRLLDLHGKYILLKFVPVVEQERKTIIVLIQDITSRKRTEQELHQHMAHLEEMVARRTEAYERVNRELEREIAEELRIHEELKYVARLWSSTFDTIPDFISIHDNEMKFVCVNRALATFLKTTPDQLIGKTCYEVMHNRNSPWPSCPHVQAIEKNEVVTQEVDDGYIGFPVLVTCSPYFGDDGTLMGTVHVARDISHQKELLLKDEQLKHLESLKTMAGAIAHRFNNAMMAVQGNLDLMALALPEDSRESAMAANATRAAKGASLIGSMMLSYVGQKTPQFESVHLPDLVSESIAALQLPAQSLISLQCASPDEPLYCTMDRQQIKEVLESILTNAVESIGDGAGSIRITFGTEHFSTSSFPISFQNDQLKDGLYSFCRIHDTGHGILPGDLSKIFEPFFTTRFVGRGLGLALTVGIMQRHHGAITVESRPSVGTTFTVLLPSQKKMS